MIRPCVELLSGRVEHMVDSVSEDDAIKEDLNIGKH